MNGVASIKNLHAQVDQITALLVADESEAIDQIEAFSQAYYDVITALPQNFTQINPSSADELDRLYEKASALQGDIRGLIKSLKECHTQSQLHRRASATYSAQTPKKLFKLERIT